jgi:hypothetical protein
VRPADLVQRQVKVDESVVPKFFDEFAALEMSAGQVGG